MTATANQFGVWTTGQFNDDRQFRSAADQGNLSLISPGDGASGYGYQNYVRRTWNWSWVRNPVWWQSYLGVATDTKALWGLTQTFSVFALAKYQLTGWDRSTSHPSWGISADGLTLFATGANVIGSAAAYSNTAPTVGRCEFTIPNSFAGMNFGLMPANSIFDWPGDTAGCGYATTGQIFLVGTTLTTVAAWSSVDVMGMERNGNTLYFTKNGVLVYTADITSIGGQTLYAAVSGNPGNLLTGQSGVQGNFTGPFIYPATNVATPWDATTPAAVASLTRTTGKLLRGGPAGGVGTTVTLDSNAANTSTDWTISGGSLTVTRTAGGAGSNATAIATLGKSSTTGEGYFEVVFTTAPTQCGVGLGPAGFASDYLHDQGFAYITDNRLDLQNAAVSNGATWTSADIIGIYMRNGRVWAHKNGVWQGSGGDPNSGGAGLSLAGIAATVYPGVFTNTASTAGAACTANFGATPFVYAIPVGGTSWDGSRPRGTVASLVRQVGKLLLASALPLRDNFDDNSMDTTKWAVGGFWSGSPTGGTTSEVNSRLECTPTPGAATATGYVSINKYNIAGDGIFARITIPGAFSGTEQAYIAFGQDANNCYTMFTTGVGGQVYCRRVNGGVLSDQPFPYVAATHAWLRIRYQASNDTVYFETAPSTASNPPISSDWVAQKSDARQGVDPTNAFVALGAATWSGDASPTVAYFDGFNMATTGSIVASLVRQVGKKVSALNAPMATLTKRVFLGALQALQGSPFPALNADGTLTYGTSPSGFGKYITGDGEVLGNLNGGADIVPESRTFTIEFRFRIATPPTGHDTYLFYVPNKVAIYIDTAGHFVFQLRNSQTGTLNVCDGNWHHFRATTTFSGGVAATYTFIDGVLDSSNTLFNYADILAYQFDVVYIHGVGSPGYNFTGDMDELAVWTTVMNGNSNFMPPATTYNGTEANLYALFHFDDDLRSGKPGSAASLVRSVGKLLQVVQAPGASLTAARVSLVSALASSALIGRLLRGVSKLATRAVTVAASLTALKSGGTPINALASTAPVASNIYTIVKRLTAQASASTTVQVIRQVIKIVAVNLSSATSLQKIATLIRTASTAPLASVVRSAGKLLTRTTAPVARLITGKATLVPLQGAASAVSSLKRGIQKMLPVDARQFTPIMVSDFKNGAYSLNGVTVPIGTLWTQSNPNWAVFNPPVAGVGLTATATAYDFEGPVATAAVLSLIDPAVGIVVVVEYAVSGPNAWVDVEWYDAPSYNTDLQLYVVTGVPETVSAYDFSGAHPANNTVSQVATPNTPTTAFKRTAALLSLGSIAVSDDGSPAVAAAVAGLVSNPNALGVGVGVTGAGASSTATIMKISLYPASALSSVSDLAKLSSVDMSGGLRDVASLVRNAIARISALSSTAPIGAAFRAITLRRQALASTATSLLRQATKLLQGAASTSSTATRQATKLLQVGSSALGSMTRSVGKKTLGSSTSVASLKRDVSKLAQGVATASVSLQRSVGHLAQVAVATVSTLRRVTAKALAGSTSPAASVTLLKALSQKLQASTAAVASITLLKSFLRSLLAQTAPTATLAAIRVFLVKPQASTAPLAKLVRAAAVKLIAQTSPVAALAKRWATQLSSSTAPIASLIRTASRKAQASTAAAASATAFRVSLLTAQAATAAQAKLTRLIARLSQALTSPSASLLKNVPRLAQASTAPITSFSKRVSLAKNAVAATTTSLVRSVNLTKQAITNPLASMRTVFALIRQVSAGTQATLRRAVSKSLTALTGAAGSLRLVVPRSANASTAPVSIATLILSAGLKLQATANAVPSLAKQFAKQAQATGNTVASLIRSVPRLAHVAVSTVATARRTASMQMQAMTAPVAALVRRMGLSLQIATQPVATQAKSVLVSLQATAAGVASLTKRSVKALQATAGTVASSTADRITYIAAAAQAGVATSFAKTVQLISQVSGIVQASVLAQYIRAAIRRAIRWSHWL